MDGVESTRGIRRTIGSTHGYCGAPQEGLECAVFSVAGNGEGLSGFKLAAEELDDGREFACDDGERAEDDCTEEIGVPGQHESGAFDDWK